MCGGLHRSLKVGDFILPTAAIRDEGRLASFHAAASPGASDLQDPEIRFSDHRGKGLGLPNRSRSYYGLSFLGIRSEIQSQLYEERALAIDMETATLFVGGFASKVPIGALLLVSDLPLQRGGIKTKKSAKAVFRRFTDLHLEIGIKSMSEIAERGEHIRHYKW